MNTNLKYMIIFESILFLLLATSVDVNKVAKTNKCSDGPSYWCDSLNNYKKCTGVKDSNADTNGYNKLCKKPFNKCFAGSYYVFASPGFKRILEGVFKGNI
jgi:hypothetical protein